MAFQVSAGVNVSEIDLTTIIPAVSTSTGAAAIHSTWGPVGKRVLIDTEDNLVAQFGKPSANTYQDFFPAANFLGYSNQLYVVRVVYANNGVGLAASRTATANGTGTVFVKNDDDYYNNYEASGIGGVGPYIAKYPGEIGNSLRVSTCHNANGWQQTLTAGFAFVSNSTTVTVTKSGAGVAAANAAVNVVKAAFNVGDILLAGPDKEEVKIASLGASSANSTVGTFAITLQGKYQGNNATQTTATRRWEFFNFFDASPGTSAYVSKFGCTNDESHIAVIDGKGRITGVANTVLERFANVSRASDAKSVDGTTNYYKNVINQNSQWIWWARHPTSQTNAGKRAETNASLNFGAGTSDVYYHSGFGSGRDGNQPRNADYIDGFNKFASAEDVDVSLIIAGQSNQTIATHLINNVAETRKDCLVCLSPRSADVVNNSGYIGAEMDDIIAFRNVLPSSSYATLDSGYKYQYDKYNDVYRYIAVNGDTAGLMARTDNDRDPWYSPAGFNRGQIKNVIKLPYNPQKAQRDQLYKSGINPVVTFPGQGTILYGDKTLLAKPSAFDRINVRRLFIVLEKAISIAAKFTLFEFNDEFTRAQFRNLVEPFLRDVQGRRGIYDFRVVCDETNNTPEVIDGNRFIGDIYIKPARSINFIQLNFVAVRTGVDFTEIVGKF
jgi:hypothetical protein